MDTQMMIEFGILIVVLITARILYLIHKITTGFTRNSTTKRTSPCKTLICIGSGGHTTEMLILMESLNIKKYSPRYYVIAKTDTTSEAAVKKFESTLDNNFKIVKIPRSRHVNQSYFTSVFTTLYSVLFSIPAVLKIRPELILCNGPGTCIPICLTSFLLKAACITETRILFVESFCRVETLSLTGKILLYFADNFIVQWPKLKQKFKRTEYLGQLM